MAVAPCALAQAQSQDASSPYYIGVSQGFTHDSNVHRTPTGEVSETISSTGVLAGVDQRLGRQRVRADASAQVNRYQTDDSLNNKSYALSAALDWETIDFLTGSLRYATRNSLSNFSVAGRPNILSDLTTQEFDATASYGLASYLALDAGYGHRRLKYANPELTDRNYSQDAVNAGARWIVGSKLTLGAGVRVTKGSSPEFDRTQTPPAADDLKRRDINLTASWVPTGFSTVNARVSATKETHTLATNAEVSGTTGSISWNYLPTGKLSFLSSLSRDTGAETTFLTSATDGSRLAPVDNSRLSTTTSVQTRYLLTGKSALHAGVQHRNGTGTDSTKEAIRTYSLGGTYSPTRNISLACNIARETRSVDSALAYRTTVTGCSAEVSLR